jgi:hypothetical protein
MISVVFVSFGFMDFYKYTVSYLGPYSDQFFLAFIFPDSSELLSYVCPYVIFSHFHILLKDLTNYNQTWHKSSLGEEIEIVNSLKSGLIKKNKN